MEYGLESVPIPVSHVDRAKAFFAEKVGFDVDLDAGADAERRVSSERRVVQLSLPGSACSIAFGIGILDTQPGSVRALHLVVSAIGAARAELVSRGVEVGEVEGLGGFLYAPFGDQEETAGPCSSCPISLFTRLRRR